MHAGAKSTRHAHVINTHTPATRPHSVNTTVFDQIQLAAWQMAPSVAQPPPHTLHAPPRCCSLPSRVLRKTGEIADLRGTVRSLGVCNGCQLMALMGIAPFGNFVGADEPAADALPETSQPRFYFNKSGRFESRKHPLPTIPFGNLCLNLPPRPILPQPSQNPPHPCSSAQVSRL